MAALGRAELELARDYFFDALAMLPGDRKTQFNLEWTLRALSAGAPRQDPPPDPPPAPPPPEKRDPPEASDETETPMQLRLPAPEVPGEDGHEEAEQATAPAPLRPEERERWLRRVDDDPRRALASAARHEGNAGRPARRSEIAW